MVEHHAVALLKPPHAGAGCDNLSTRLMPGHHARLVAFRPLAQMLVVDAADIGAADGGRFGFNQHLAMAELRNFVLLKFNRAIARQIGSCHCFWNRSHWSSPLVRQNNLEAE